MSSSSPSAYSRVIADLLHEPRLMPLGPGEPNRPALLKLRAASAERLFEPRPIRDADMASACLAGLWLYHDFLDESHTISQGIETVDGSYWHGLMHRREPDFSNAKYWFRQVSDHPVFAPLAEAAGTLAADEPHPAAMFLKTGSAWDPFAFIDLCEASHTGRVPCESLCRQIQQREWELLFDHCYRLAVGAGG